MRKFYRGARVPPRMIGDMSRDTHSESTLTRVIAVPLSEAEWGAFLTVEPEPVAWLRLRIRERLQLAGRWNEAELREEAVGRE